MKFLLPAFLLIHSFGFGQKITRMVNPEDHSVWLLTDNATLRTGAAGGGQMIVRFRVEGSTVYLYIQGNQDPITERDWAAFITDADTVVAHSTNLQPGIGFHEYRMGSSDLEKLARHPVKKVILSHLNGFQQTDVPEKNQGRLMVFAAALFKAIGG